jgi:hypothetical protein
MFGCDQFQDYYANYPQFCNNPRPLGYISAAYHAFLAVFGVQILLSLFIGVITNSMEEAIDKSEASIKMEKALAKRAAKLSLSKERIEAFRNVFKMFDLDEDGSIDEQELRLGCKAIDAMPKEDIFQEYIYMVDPKREGLNLASFVEFMSLQPSYKKDVMLYSLSSFLSIYSTHKPSIWTKVWDYLCSRQRKLRELEAAMALQIAWRNRRARIKKRLEEEGDAETLQKKNISLKTVSAKHAPDVSKPVTRRSLRNESRALKILENVNQSKLLMSMKLKEEGQREEEENSPVIEKRRLSCLVIAEYNE